jgi:hypothetical protein
MSGSATSDSGVHATAARAGPAAPQAWMRFMAGSYSGRAETTAG